MIGSDSVVGKKHVLSVCFSLKEAVKVWKTENLLLFSKLYNSLIVSFSKGLILTVKMLKELKEICVCTASVWLLWKCLRQNTGFSFKAAVILKYFSLPGSVCQSVHYPVVVLKCWSGSDVKCPTDKKKEKRKKGPEDGGYSAVKKFFLIFTLNCPT